MKEEKMKFNTIGAIVALSSLDKKKTSKKDRSRAIMLGAFSADPLTGIVAGQKVKADTEKKEKQKQVSEMSSTIAQLNLKIEDLQGKIPPVPGGGGDAVEIDGQIEDAFQRALDKRMDALKQEVANQCMAGTTAAINDLKAQFEKAQQVIEESVKEELASLSQIKIAASDLVKTYKGLKAVDAKNIDGVTAFKSSLDELAELL